MPGPTPSWNLVRIYGTWRGQDGALKAGTYKVTIPARITNTTDDAIIPAGTYASGALQTTVNGSPSLDVLVPATDDPDNAETGWKVTLTVTFPDAGSENYIIDVPVANRPTVDGGNGVGVNLRTVALTTAIPQQVALYKVGVPGGLAKLNDLGQVVDSNGNLVAGSSDWASLTGKPATFAPTIGTTSTTAKAGNYAPTWTEITSKPATFAPTVGTTATTAKAGDYVPAWAEITGKPATYAPTIGATATTAVAGNDARLTNSRTPTAHSTTHATGGIDPIAPADIGAAAALHSHSPAQLAGAGTRDATTFYRGDGTWVSQDSLPVSTATQAALNLKADEVDLPTLLSQLGGQITTAQVAPRTVMRVLWTGTAWPSSPAGGRTDISIDWVDEFGTSTAPPIVAGRGDVWLKAV